MAENRYPSWMYHPQHGGRIFNTLAEIRQAEADGWYDSPGKWNQQPALPDFDALSKREIAAWAFEKYGLDLDWRRRKEDLLDAVIMAIRGGR